MNTIIKANKICKSFVTDGETNNVIKNLDLEIYEGDFTVIMGSSGSGKSTLMYMLSGMDKSTCGDVYLDEKNLSQMNENALASTRKEKIGFVFQSMNLIPDLTVRENILSPAYRSKQSKAAAAKRADELMEQMGLTEHKNKFPSQLSGGQAQRTAICRAIINSPEIVFADEPTGALNSSAGEKVLEIFSEINKGGQSIVMVTHDLKAASYGNRIIFLRDGRVDGDLKLGKYSKEAAKEREQVLYTFLKERGW